MSSIPNNDLTPISHNNTNSNHKESEWGYWWVYERSQRELSERVEKLEHTIYMGNGRPSLVQQVAEISLRLNEVARTLESLAKSSQQRQFTRYQVFLETASFAVVTLLATFLSSWLAVRQIDSSHLRQVQEPAIPQHRR